MGILCGYFVCWVEFDELCLFYLLEKIYIDFQLGGMQTADD